MWYVCRVSDSSPVLRWEQGWEGRWCEGSLCLCPPQGVASEPHGATASCSLSKLSPQERLPEQRHMGCPTPLTKSPGVVLATQAGSETGVGLCGGYGAKMGNARGGPWFPGRHGEPENKVGNPTLRFALGQLGGRQPQQRHSWQLACHPRPSGIKCPCFQRDV